MGALETSTARKLALRSFFESRDWVKGLNPEYKFEECARRLELWDDTGCVKLGWFCKHENEWKWDVAVSATIGVRLPIDITDEHNATPRAEDQGQAPGDAPRGPKDDNMQADEQQQEPTEQNAQNEGEKRAAESSTTSASLKTAKVLQHNNTQ